MAGIFASRRIHNGEIMAEITIYQKPTCTTCRQAVQIIKDRGLSFKSVNYYDTPFSKSQLKGLLKKAGLKPKDVIRTKEDIYKNLGLAKKDPNDEELLTLMIQHPDLIQRPLVVKGDHVILARPADTLKDFLQ